MNIQVTYNAAGPEALAFAAAELRAYLTRMLPDRGSDIAIALALRPAAPAENDAFSAEIAPTGGTIIGNSGRAVLLGVYDLLRTLGCRFLAPGRDNERVPAIPQERLSARYAHEASHRHRGVCLEGADARENILDFIDWLPKAGFNSFFLQFKTPYAFLERWYHHMHNPRLTPEPYGPGDAETVMAQAEAAMARRGLLLHKVGHGWTGEVLGFETVTWHPGCQPLAEDRRPLAAMVKGQRGLFQGVPANTNLCLSNSEAVDRFAALVVQYAREHPAVDYLHIWLADNFNNVCECDACRATTPADQYAALLNEIDRRLTAEGLDTKLVFLLYQELLWPPVRERLQNPERFVLMFAPISRTFSHSYDPALGAGAIPPYRRNRITLPQSLGENLAFLRRWQEQFAGDSFVYDYPLGRAHYGDLGYVHMARLVHGDIQRLGDLGLQGYISCQELRAGMPNFLPDYVMGRTLLDRDVDIEELMREYFQAAYGENADVAHGFLADLSALQLCDYINGNGPRVNDDAARKAARARALCQAFSEQAAALPAPSDAVAAGFWTRLRYHAQYGARLARAVELLAQGRRAEAAAAWGEMRDFIGAHEETYQPWLDVYRVVDVTGNYTGLSPA